MLFIIAFGCGFSGAAGAADVTAENGLPDAVTFSGSIGHLNGMAHERVYLEDGTKLSQLDWDMEHALVLNGALSFQATNRLKLYGNLSVGLAADNYMDDYDWIGAPPPHDADLHSWHDDTELDHYYAIDAGAAFEMYESGPHSLSVLGGFKYTDVQWTASGGCYDYTYYDEKGCIDDGVKVITYRQSLPVLYGGLGYSGSFDRWSLSLDGRVGMTLSNASADDDHWLRDLNFVDHLNSAPYVAINSKAGYSVHEAIDVFASVAFDKFFEMRGETTYTEKDTGYSERSNYDTGGADLYTLNVAIGLDYRF